jgi:hypothetical protein
LTLARIQWIARLIALLGLGYFCGAMIEEFYIVSILMSHLDGVTFAKGHVTFGIFHPYTAIPHGVIGATAALCAAAVLRPRFSLQSLFTWIPGLLGLFNGIWSLFVMFPVNMKIGAWIEYGAPEDWKKTRDAWIGLQYIRMWVATVAFSLLVVGTLLPFPTLETLSNKKKKDN